MIDCDVLVGSISTSTCIKNTVNHSIPIMTYFKHVQIFFFAKTYLIISINYTGVDVSLEILSTKISQSIKLEKMSRKSSFGRKLSDLVKSLDNMKIENEESPEVDDLADCLNDMKIAPTSGNNRSSTISNKSRNSTEVPPPTKTQIIELAKESGYVRKSEYNGRLYFTYEKMQGTADEINIHVYYNTRTVATNINHPVQGRKTIWRKDAYNNLETLEAYFIYPRVHTDFGYSTAENAKALCKGCYNKLTRNHFEESDWRRVGREGEVVFCQDCKGKDSLPNVFVPTCKQEQSGKVLQQWVNEGKKTMVPVVLGNSKLANLNPSIQQPMKHQDKKHQEMKNPVANDRPYKPSEDKVRQRRLAPLRTNDRWKN